MNPAPLIDHTNLKPDFLDIKLLCDQAVNFGFRGVCISPHLVQEAAARLSHTTDIEVSTVIGFPDGWSHCKLEESKKALDDGATELDIVINIVDLKRRKFLNILRELTAIRKLDNTVARPILFKIIVEEQLLDKYELETIYYIVVDSGCQCIKTSTGRLRYSTTPETVKFWSTLGDLQIKAASGIRTYQRLQELVQAGADIIGTSHGIEIVREYRAVSQQVKLTEVMEL